MVDTLAPKKIFTQRDLDTKLTPVSEQVLRTRTRPSLLDDRPKVVGTATSLIKEQSKDFLLDAENMMPKVVTAEQKQTAKSSEETIKEKQTGMRAERETPQGEALAMRPVEYASTGIFDKPVLKPILVGEKGAEMIVPTGDGKISILPNEVVQGLMERPTQLAYSPGDDDDKKEIKPKKFSFDDFLKLPRDEQKAIFSIMFRSYGQGPKENVDD
tara:strand:- start:585 stop:1226 length:642 start_codon:yes stop_codon:yes gene_type:complete